ncbi:MAG TPA: protease modulator HflC, partial [Gemmataceae bacterium]|nr:protease modulator HflC [Gemmataceae bacterium]
MRYLLLIGGLVLVALLVRGSFLTVNPTEFVYVTQFGRHVATYDGGARDSDAGLHFRLPWPIQSVQRLDRRLQFFDLPDNEVLTHDPKSQKADKKLTFAAYVCWRILDKDSDPGGVDRFIRRIGTPERVKEILGKRVNSLLSARIGRARMDDLISTASTTDGKKQVDVKVEDMRRELLAELTTQLRDEYGIDLVDVRLRRFNHPLDVRDSIFERIKSERARKAAEYESEGQQKVAKIKSDAEEKRRDLLANARATEKILKGDADTEADAIRNRAHRKDPEFYAFLKKLEKMEKILADNKTVLLLSTHRPLFDLLFQPPRPTGPVMPPGIGSAPAGNGNAA